MSKLLLSEIQKQIAAILKDNEIIDDQGRTIFGKIIIMQLINGRFVHGESGNDPDSIRHEVIVRQTFKE